MHVGHALRVACDGCYGCELWELRQWVCEGIQRDMYTMHVGHSMQQSRDLGDGVRFRYLPVFVFAPIRWLGLLVVRVPIVYVPGVFRVRRIVLLQPWTCNNLFG